MDSGLPQGADRQYKHSGLGHRLRERHLAGERGTGRFILFGKWKDRKQGEKEGGTDSSCRNGEEGVMIWARDDMVEKSHEYCSLCISTTDMFEWESAVAALRGG